MNESTWFTQTARLRLRQFTLQDAPFVIELVNDPQWLTHIGERNVHNLEQAQAFIENGPFNSYKTHGFGMYVFESISSPKPLGVCGLLKREFLQYPDIGYAILPKFRGLGLTFEACQGVLAYDQEKFNLNTVQAMISPKNTPSITLIERLGFNFTDSIAPDSKPTLLYTKIQTG